MIFVMVWKYVIDMVYSYSAHQIKYSGARAENTTADETVYLPNMVAPS